MSDIPESDALLPPFLTVRQAASYLQINEKTLYALIQEGAVPATRATGKWMFPKRMLDEWLLANAHGGALTDRLLIGGSEDPLLSTAAMLLAAELRAQALVALSPTGSELGLELLSRRRINVSCVHWGPAETSATAHAELARRFPGHREWVIVRLAQREQGIMLAPSHASARSLAELAVPGVRWAARQPGAGSQHFFREVLRQHNVVFQALDVGETALSERHAATLVAQRLADCAPGVRAAATEFGLAFLPLGWEAFDFVLPREVYFRALFQQLLAVLGSEHIRTVAGALRGYDLTDLGRIVSAPPDAHETLPLALRGV
jgi:excisionase family DNA binding protein